MAILRDDIFRSVMLSSVPPAKYKMTKSYYSGTLKYQGDMPYCPCYCPGVRIK